MGWQVIEYRAVTDASIASVTFSNIPQTYKSLKVVASVRSNAAANWSDFSIQPNSDSSTNYWKNYVYGDGTAASAGGSGSANVLAYANGNSATAGIYSSVTISIPYYTSSAYKPIVVEVVTENNATSSLQMLDIGVWKSTSALTSLYLGTASYTFLFGSTFTLYGLL